MSKKPIEPMDQSKLRERAVLYARNDQWHDDVTRSMEAMYRLRNPNIIGVGGDRLDGSQYVVPTDARPADSLVVTDTSQFKIGIDNMVARAFEMGYAAALDDLEPGRALHDKQPGKLRRLFGRKT